MTENLLEINVRHQTTYPESSDNMKQDKCPPNPITLSHIIFKLQNTKDKEKILKEAGGAGPYQQRNKDKNYSGFLIGKPCKKDENKMKYLKC